MTPKYILTISIIVISDLDMTHSMKTRFTTILQLLNDYDNVISDAGLLFALLSEVCYWVENNSGIPSTGHIIWLPVQKLLWYLLKYNCLTWLNKKATFTTVKFLSQWKIAVFCLTHEHSGWRHFHFTNYFYWLRIWNHVIYIK